MCQVFFFVRSAFRDPCSICKIAPELVFLRLHFQLSSPTLHFHCWMWGVSGQQSCFFPPLKTISKVQLGAVPSVFSGRLGHTIWVRSFWLSTLKLVTQVHASCMHLPFLSWNCGCVGTAVNPANSLHLEPSYCEMLAFSALGILPGGKLLFGEQNVADHASKLLW